MKERKGDKEISMDYPEVLETACLTGPKPMIRYASRARYKIVSGYLETYINDKITN